MNPSNSRLLITFIRWQIQLDMLTTTRAALTHHHINKINSACCSDRILSLLFMDFTIERNYFWLIWRINFFIELALRRWLL